MHGHALVCACIMCEYNNQRCKYAYWQTDSNWQQMQLYFQLGVSASVHRGNFACGGTDLNVHSKQVVLPAPLPCTNGNVSIRLLMMGVQHPRHQHSHEITNKTAAPVAEYLPGFTPWNESSCT